MVVVVSVSGLVLLDWTNNMKNSTCFSCVCPSEHVCRAYMNYMVATELEHCTNTSCRLHITILLPGCVFMLWPGWVSVGETIACTGWEAFKG